MILFPNAKINLGLHILHKREDNFHELETMMYPVGLCDILEFLPSPEIATNLRMSGIPVTGEMEENLVYKAYLLLKDSFKLPELKIHLHKIIPTGAGLGGGSSDAAFMLKGLDKFFGLNLSIKELKGYAEILGSDCSFFIENLPAMAAGRGEILTSASSILNNNKIVLYFPGFPVSTKDAYSGVIPDSKRDSLNGIIGSGVSNWKGTLVNDFEKTVFKKFPRLEDLKNKLYRNGAVYASMSGSGSAVFGVFDRDFEMPEDLYEYLIWES